MSNLLKCNLTDEEIIAILTIYRNSDVMIAIKAVANEAAVRQRAKDAALISEATFNQRTALALKKRLFNVPNCELAKAILDKEI